MKLLIVTQVVDKNHPALGFFLGWVEEFAKHCDEVQVLCLQKGEFDLPENVFVYSLGKEGRPASALVYTLRLLKYSWQLRNRYDSVFVHMNPEYVVAGASVWALLRKPVYLWYTHGAVSFSLKLAEQLVKNIFTAAEDGMNLQSSKVIVTGHGIDVQGSHAHEQKRDLDMIIVGRISRSKNLEDLISLLEAVRSKLPTATLTIVGSAQNEDGQSYQTEIIKLVKEKELVEAVNWVGGVPHAEVPNWLACAKVFVHTAKNGSLDKVLLEALAVGTPLVSSAPGARSLPLGEWLVDSPDALATQTLAIMQNYPAAEMQRLKLYVAKEHGLKALIESLTLKMR